MIPVRREDIFHKTQLFRLLTEIIDEANLSQNLFFKGGTCASMLGFLDRFSVDLDFDLKNGANKSSMRQSFYRVFKKLDLVVTSENKNAVQFILKYEAPPSLRNSVKISALDLTVKANTYQVQYLAEIDRMMNCQTIETMFANKLVAPLDRFAKHEKIAGRDIYDIHHFFLKGYSYNSQVIRERMGMDLQNFFKKLIEFIEKKISQTIINQDLNTLLPYDQFQKIRKVLKQETLMFLQNIQQNH